MKRERVLIVGTGAMACWFAARLAPQNEVTMAGRWPEGLEALRRDGPGRVARGTHRVAGIYSTGCRCAGLVKAFTGLHRGKLSRWLPDGGRDAAEQIKPGASSAPARIMRWGTTPATLVQPRRGRRRPAHRRHQRTPPSLP
jgi:hypothetical protein